MKTLHRMIVKAFLGPFAIAFMIVVFILVMQFLWKYVDDLMGKGLEWHVVAELLVYAAASFVPLALPLAILLSGIMTLGGLGENSELIPMRGAGLGLPSILLPLGAFVALLSVGSFYFSNNLLPVANLKFKSLLWDVTEKKPALNITPGVFYNGIEGFSIRVSDKNADTGELTDVLIYDHRSGGKKSTAIRARRGRMQRSGDGHFLLLTLEDGRLYDESGVTGNERSRSPLLRGTFVKDRVAIDLTGLGLKRTDEELFKDNYRMLTMSQLKDNMDSLQRRMDDRRAEQLAHARASVALLRPFALRNAGRDSASSMRSYLGNLLPEQRESVFAMAMDMARANARFMENTVTEMDGRRSLLAKHAVEWHRKPMLAAACLIFFLIGAPLGAIIRKGGMGLPVVAAVIFFLIFHIVSFSTEKLVIAGEVGAWPGMWVSSMVLLPIGLWITWKASTDSPLFDRDAYHRGWERLRAALRRNAHPPTVQ
jgi:lipopolysaccharide export system permease protein